MIDDEDDDSKSDNANNTREKCYIIVKSSKGKMIP